MTTYRIVPLGYGLSAVLCLGTTGPGREDEKRPPTVRVYTNEDLDRVRPFRDELGASSVPAVSPVERSASSRAPREGSPRQGEEFWRREAEKVRERLGVLRDQAEALRARIVEREAAQRRATRTIRQFASERRDTTLETRLAAIERRMRDIEEDFADRARRAGALPGWLRE